MWLICDASENYQIMQKELFMQVDLNFQSD